jgi:hypothetical protein
LLVGTVEEGHGIPLLAVQGKELHIQDGILEEAQVFQPSWVRNGLQGRDLPVMDGAWVASDGDSDAKGVHGSRDAPLLDSTVAEMEPMMVEAPLVHAFPDGIPPLLVLADENLGIQGFDEKDEEVDVILPNSFAVVTKKIWAAIS